MVRVELLLDGTRFGKPLYLLDKETIIETIRERPECVKDYRIVRERKGTATEYAGGVKRWT